MIKANLVLMRNILIVLLSVVVVNGADVITLAIEHHINDDLIDGGQYIDGKLYVWTPSSDIDDPEQFNFEGDSEITLELEEPGLYFFWAQTVLYDEDGTIVAHSAETEILDFEVEDPTDTPIPDRDADDPDPAAPDQEDRSAPVADSVDGSSYGCFVSSLSIQ